MDFWITISFFFGGAILGRFISRVVGISHASLAYEELDKSVLSMLIAVDKDISSALSTKYRALDAAEIPADVISRIKKIDERALNKALKELGGTRAGGGYDPKNDSTIAILQREFKDKGTLLEFARGLSFNLIEVSQRTGKEKVINVKRRKG